MSSTAVARADAPNLDILFDGEYLQLMRLPPGLTAQLRISGGKGGPTRGRTFGRGLEEACQIKRQRTSTRSSFLAKNATLRHAWLWSKFAKGTREPDTHCKTLRSTKGASPLFGTSLLAEAVHKKHRLKGTYSASNGHEARLAPSKAHD
jgi:hypothetical protein